MCPRAHIICRVFVLWIFRHASTFVRKTQMKKRQFCHKSCRMRNAECTSGQVLLFFYQYAATIILANAITILTNDNLDLRQGQNLIEGHLYSDTRLPRRLAVDGSMSQSGQPFWQSTLAALCCTHRSSDPEAVSFLHGTRHVCSHRRLLRPSKSLPH
jgi:hypothetical protein